MFLWWLLAPTVIEVSTQERVIASIKENNENQLIACNTARTEQHSEIGPPGPTWLFHESGYTKNIDVSIK